MFSSAWPKQSRQSGQQIFPKFPLYLRELAGSRKYCLEFSEQWLETNDAKLKFRCFAVGIASCQCWHHWVLDCWKDGKIYCKMGRICKQNQEQNKAIWIPNRGPPGKMEYNANIIIQVRQQVRLIPKAPRRQGDLHELEREGGVTLLTNWTWTCVFVAQWLIHRWRD